MDNTLQRGLNWLRACQRADGSWPDFLVAPDVEGNEWPTGYICALLSDLPTPLEPRWNSMLTLACAFLRNRSRLSAGWGFSSAASIDADSTAWCMLSLLRSKEAKAEWFAAERKELREHQHAGTGGFSTYRRKNAGPFPEDSGYYAPTPCVTASVVLALHELGCADDMPLIHSGLTYLSAERDDSGAWDSPWWDSEIYSTATVVRLFVVLGYELQALSVTRTWLENLQDKDGSWRTNSLKSPDPFLTSLAIRALLDLGAPPCCSSVKRGRTWLFETQCADGSWDGPPILRLPSPYKPWVRGDIYDGIVVAGHHRTLATASIIATLARFAQT
jgi:squalene cyclase